jgi:flagellar protein FliO/FliZ
MQGVAWSSLLWFALVVAAIPFALALLKRTPLGGGLAGNGTLRVVAALPLGASQRIVTVEVGHGAERRWLVIGVTPQSMATLHTMAPGDAGVAQPAVPQPPFAQLVRRWSRPGSDDAR